MAKHSATLKRLPIKHVRDKAKAKYQKGIQCEICGTDQELDFHHYHTLTPLWEKWVREKGYSISTDEDTLAVRDEFIAEKHDELYVHTVTLCHKHHMALHAVYGKDPALTTAEKQKKWVGIQRDKHEAKKLAG